MNDQTMDGRMVCGSAQTLEHVGQITVAAALPGQPGPGGCKIERWLLVCLFEFIHSK